MPAKTKASTNGADPAKTLEVPELKVAQVNIHIEGTSSLICHRFDEKAKKQMLDKQMKRASKGKAAKDPEADYRKSLYELDGGGYGFPSVAFKAAAVRAGTYSDMKMTFLRGAFHTLGELVKIDGEPTPREDMVRVGNGVADIRYRGEFIEWGAVVPVEVNEAVLSIEQLVSLFRTAGFAVGIGDWRPERDGVHGRFEVSKVEA